MNRKTAFRTRAVMAGFLLSLSSSAALALDDNIRISNFFDENNQDAYWNQSSDTRQQAMFQNLVRDLGMATSASALGPGETLGVYGFEVGLDYRLQHVPRRTTTSTISDDLSKQISKADHWRTLDDDHRLSMGEAILLPTLRLRKGLPFSTEVGADMSWFSFSHQAALSFYARGAIHEGIWDKEWRAIPDVSFCLATTRFVGNEELDLSSLEWGMTLGWTFPVSGVRDSHVGTFSPFIGLGGLYITAVPTGPLPDETQRLVGVTGLRADVVDFADEEVATQLAQGEREVLYLDTLRPWKLSLGMRLTSGIFRWVAGLELAAGAPNDFIEGITSGGDIIDIAPPAGALSRARFTLGTGFVY